MKRNCYCATQHLLALFPVFVSRAVRSGARTSELGESTGAKRHFGRSEQAVGFCQPHHGVWGIYMTVPAHITFINVEYSSFKSSPPHLT